MRSNSVQPPAQSVSDERSRSPRSSSHSSQQRDELRRTMRPWNTQQIKQLEPQGRRQGTESASGEGKPDLNVVGDQLGDEDWDLLAHSVQDARHFEKSKIAGDQAIKKARVAAERDPSKDSAIAYFFRVNRQSASSGSGSPAGVRPPSSDNKPRGALL